MNYMFENNRTERPKIMQAVLTVKEKIYLTPHYIRIVLEGNDVSLFAAARVGDNNKIIIPQNNTPITLADLERGRGAGKGESTHPLIRTYTLRKLDLENKLMTIDFVGHGENGTASKWATYAEAGDTLGVLMKIKEKALFLPADWYLLAGDHTALPVISVILESLPNDAKGKAIVEVYSADDVLELKKPENVELIWKFNPQPGEISTLSKYFRSMSLSNVGSKFIFAAAESVVIDEIQQILRNTTGLAREQWQAYSYWKYGQSEGVLLGERGKKYKE